LILVLAGDMFCQQAKQSRQVEMRKLGASKDLLRYLQGEAVVNIQKVYCSCKESGILRATASKISLTTKDINLPCGRFFDTGASRSLDIDKTFHFR
jgi:hypothetical protein